MCRVSVSIAGVISLVAVLLSTPAAEAQQQCSVWTTSCPSGRDFRACANSAGSCWYETSGGGTYPCDAGCNCMAAAQKVADLCTGSGGGSTCSNKCGSSCCTASQQCCGDVCAPSGATCCGAGYCESGSSCCNNACIPSTASCCGTGSCAAGTTCCNDQCIPEGATCCGQGSCATGEECANGLCLPMNAVICKDGSMCPENTACASTKCCPEGFASYDPVSGYCCGAGPEAGLCDCPVGCASLCCPANTVCCIGGYCAPSADGCPKCPANAPKFCSDHKCVPANATCCGNGYYCTNSLSCMDCGNGQTCCGNSSIPATPTGAPQNTGSAVPPASAPPVGPSTKGNTPDQPSSRPSPGTPPAGAKSATSTLGKDRIGYACKGEPGKRDAGTGDAPGRGSATLGGLLLIQRLGSRRRRRR